MAGNVAQGSETTLANAIADEAGTSINSSGTMSFKALSILVRVRDFDGDDAEGKSVVLSILVT